MLSHIRSGALKAYAVTTRKRLDNLPDVPTMEEVGFPGYDASQWFVVAASPKIPSDRLAKLNELLAQVYQSSEFKKAVNSAG